MCLRELEPASNPSSVWDYYLCDPGWDYFTFQGLNCLNYKVGKIIVSNSESFGEALTERCLFRAQPQDTLEHA